MPRTRTLSNGQILDAAVALVCRQGTESLTFASLGSKVGLAPATLVQRFKSKQQLLIETALYCLQGMDAAFSNARAKHASPLLVIKATLINMAASVASVEEYARGLAFFSTALLDSKTQSLLRDSATSIQDELTALLEQAVAAEELAPCNTEEMASILQAIYEGAIVTWAMCGQAIPVKEWVASRIDAVLAPHIINKKGTYAQSSITNDDQSKRESRHARELD